MSELLNCPFCGSRCVTLLNGGPGNHYVRCDDCLASSNDVGRDRAVELWNRRTLAPAQDTGMAAPGYRTGLTYGDGYKAAIEQCAKIADPWPGFNVGQKIAEPDLSVIEVRTKIAGAIRSLATPSTHSEAPSCKHPNAAVWFYRDDDAYMRCPDCNSRWCVEPTPSTERK